MRFQLTIFFMVALTVLTLAFPIVYGDAPNVEILKVEYPNQVFAGEVFNINVSISYSYNGWTLAELGVFHKNFTNIFDYIRYYLTGKTTKTFSLTVVAPLKSMNLDLKVVTRYWYQNFWITTQKGITEFSIEVYSLNEREIVKEEPLVVNINGSEWYYWNNNFSDTCVIWLSGGHAYKDHITINPYEMETFSAMKYINDLAKEYSVLALQKGFDKVSMPFTNQEFYALSYYSNSNFLKNLHDWSLRKGYNFTYLIGYSTGGVAAGYEVAVKAPEDWAAPNGAIIISAPLKGVNGLLNSVSCAFNIKSNIQLIYGMVWSDELWPQGKEFYDNAPEKTEYPWYFKAWSLFSDSSHEVWVKEEDGAHYNKKAFNLTVWFIEKSKALWFSFKGGEAIVKLEVKAVNQKGFCKALLFKEDYSFQKYFYLEVGDEKYKENLTSSFRKLNWKVNASTINLNFNSLEKKASLTFIIENFSEEKNDSWIIKLHPLKDWFWNQTGATFTFYNNEELNPTPLSLNILIIELPKDAVNISFNQQRFEIEYCLKQTANLSLRIELEKTRFVIGEKIIFKLKVTNDAQQQLTYKKSSVTFKVVDSKGGIIYSAFKDFENNYEVIDPGQTVVYEFSWDQINNNGIQAPPGIYKIIGCVENFNVEKEIQLNASSIPGYQLTSVLLGLFFGAFMLFLKKIKNLIHH